MTSISMLQKSTYKHLSKSQVLKKLSKSTKNAIDSTILPLLVEKGARELSIAEVRKRLSKIKVPLSHEIIKERDSI